jgi:hypothetical protein
VRLQQGVAVAVLSGTAAPCKPDEDALTQRATNKYGVFMTDFAESYGVTLTVESQKQLGVELDRAGPYGTRSERVRGESW